MSQHIDLHSHSLHSFDGKESVGSMTQRARELGLAAYGLTDHCDLGSEDDAAYDRSIGDSVLELLAQRDAAGPNGTKLLAGIELGEPFLNLAQAEKLIGLPGLDYVICSLHNLRDMKDFYFLSYTQDSVYPLLDRYFAELYDIAKWGKFEVLGHLTYPLRYMKGEYGIPVDLTRYDDQIDAVFHLLAENGRGIEVNTSGLWQKLGETMPGRELLVRYRACGGEIVTIGSDAHASVDIGRGVKQAEALLRAVGFRYICYFEKHQPKFVKL